MLNEYNMKKIQDNTRHSLRGAKTSSEGQIAYKLAKRRTVQRELNNKISKKKGELNKRMKKLRLNFQYVILYKGSATPSF